MDKDMAAYCGLFCGHCYSRTHVAPTARRLKDYMTAQGFEDFGPFMPDFREFWAFLTTIIEAEGCPGCRQGGGDPGCEIRACAREKGHEACALCPDYPCGKFTPWLDDTTRYPMLCADNEFLRGNGMDAWRAMQQRRRDGGYTYVEARKGAKE